MRWRRTLPRLLAMLAGAALLCGCAAHESSPPPAADAGAPAKASGGPLSAIFGPTPEKSGAQLWEDNCTRCHYVRPPNYYSAAQWAVVVRHMRSRANLTGAEERKVTAFLQAGSGAEE